MSVDFIQPMESLSPLFSTQKSGETGSVDHGFSNILSDALSTAAAAEQVDHSGMVALLSGEDIEPHTTMIQSTEAEMALNLAIQIRNKVLDAYNEVMRMQV